MPSTTEPDAPRPNLKLLNWSAVLFAFLQSVCSALIALSSIRLFIGATAFASALGVVKLADKMHIPAIRIPMMLIALVGSLLNLFVLWQVWRLRRRFRLAAEARLSPKTPLGNSATGSFAGHPVLAKRRILGPLETLR
jgi:hypothetical protein